MSAQEAGSEISPAERNSRKIFQVIGKVNVLISKTPAAEIFDLCPKTVGNFHVMRDVTFTL